MKYILVTDVSGRQRLLNAEQILYVKEEKGGGAAVLMADGAVLFSVRERFEELVTELMQR